MRMPSPCVLEGLADVASTTTAASKKIKAVLNADAKFAAAYLRGQFNGERDHRAPRSTKTPTQPVNLTVDDAGGTGLVLGTISRHGLWVCATRFPSAGGSSIGIPYKLGCG